MLSAENLSEDPVGKNCVAIYKVAKAKRLPLPPSLVHCYIGGIVDRVNDPAKQQVLSTFVVQSADELCDVVQRYRHDPQPNAVPCLVARMSGDFFFNWNAQLPGEADNSFPAVCYSTAQFYAGRMGRRTESTIFGELALNLPDYAGLLSSYYSFLREHADFELTDEDFAAFKEYVNEGLRGPTIVVPAKVRQRKTDKLLM